MIVAILGAGELGAAIARILADRDTGGRVILVDADVGRARGKALDILQSGPVEGSDTRVEGAADLAAEGSPDIVVVADTAELAVHETASHRAGDFMRALASAAGQALVVVARADAAPLVEAGVGKGLRRERVVGSLPVAVAAAIRRRLADELRVEPREIAAAVLGLPPDDLVLPRESVTLGGVPVDRLSPVACRRALEAVRARTLGPLALAAAAVRVLEAARAPRRSVLPVVALLMGEYGHRGVAVGAPAYLGRGGLESVVEVALDPIDRVTFDGAVQRRRDRG